MEGGKEANGGKEEERSSHDVPQHPISGDE